MGRYGRDRTAVVGIVELVTSDVDVLPGLVVVLAAGGGTRMKSETPKVLHEILGRPLLGHVLRTATATGAARICVVVGHQRHKVERYLAEEWSGVDVAVQAEQNGTGHAVRCALEQLGSLPPGPVVVINGDTPLLEANTLLDLVAAHARSQAGVTVLSAEVLDSTGYGRIVRDEADRVAGIVEHKDATQEQLSIREINSGMYAFDPDVLGRVLGDLTTDNAQGEEYLTDALGLALSYGRTVNAYVTGDPDEVLGVNDRAQLAAVAGLLRDRVNNRHMKAGVTIVDPKTAWIGVTAVIGTDATIERNCFVSDGCDVAPEAVIGPDTTLWAATVGQGAHVLRSHVDSAQIGARAAVGPFTFLRPGTVLDADSKVGAYVEIKKSTVGPGSKVPHLSYVGDATIGAGSNIGAATIFANYDGEEKHHTSVGDEVRIGSDTVLVAPVTVGDGAYTAAGSVITEDVPPGAIGVARGRQRNIVDWVLRRRPDSRAAQVAKRATATPKSPS